MPPPAGGRASKRRAAVWCVGGCQGRHAVGDGTSPAPLTHSQRSSLVQPRGTTAPSPPPPAPRRRVPAGGGADQRHHAVRQRSRRGRVTSSAAAAAAAAAAAVRSKALSTCTVRHARWHARTRGGPGMRARETQRAQARCVAVAGSLPPPPPPPRAVTATTHRARPVAGGHESSRGWFGLAPGARLAPATVRHSLAFRKQRPIGASPPSTSTIFAHLPSAVSESGEVGPVSPLLSTGATCGAVGSAVPPLVKSVPQRPVARSGSVML